MCREQVPLLPLNLYSIIAEANLFEKMRGYPHFSLWILIAHAKIYFFHMALISKLKAHSISIHCSIVLTGLSPLTSSEERDSSHGK